MISFTEADRILIAMLRLALSSFGSNSGDFCLVCR
jgi:hypothetical protein